MQPTSSLYVSPLLTNISLAYRNENYIAEKLFPTVQVKKDTGKITTYGMDNLRIDDSERSIGSKTNETGHTVSIADHFALIEHALKELVPDEHIEQADNPIQPKIDAVQNLTDKLQVEKESSLASALSSGISLGSALSGTNKWSDFANSDPISNIRTGATAIRAASGKKPNVLALAKDVFDVLVDHPDIVDRIKYVQAADKMSTANALARIFGVDEVMVGDAQYNSAKEGKTSVLADIWTKVVYLLYVEKNPTLKSRSIGFTYQMKAPRLVDEWRDDDRKGIFVRTTDKYDQKIVDANCGYKLTTVIA